MDIVGKNLKLLFIALLLLNLFHVQARYRVGDYVQNFSIYNCDNQVINLDDFQGDVILLTFWQFL